MSETAPNLPELPGQTPELDPIPSVVAASQKKSFSLIGGFLGFMVVVGFLICRKPQPKDQPPSPDQGMAVSLPPALATARTAVPFETILSQRNRQMSGGESLLDVRRKSPMVILNKNPGSGANPAPGMAGPNDSPTGVHQEGNSASSAGVPLPRGFTPTGAVSAHATSLGDRDSLIAQGKLIDAVLETSIDSDHPGMLRALVSHDIYGDTGRTVLLPRGSRLVGQYDSAVAKGQNRVFVLWQRAIRPDGIDIQLGSAGTDPLGGTGIEGSVDYHFWAMFGAATLLSVIGNAASTVGVNPLDQNNSLAQARENITSGFNSAAGTVLGQFVQVKPTIKVRQGIEIKVFVARDLYFDPALTEGNGVVWIQ